MCAACVEYDRGKIVFEINGRYNVHEVTVDNGGPAETDHSAKMCIVLERAAKCRLNAHIKAIDFVEKFDLILSIDQRYDNTDRE